MKNGFILYKIYYKDILVYLGRTKQNLQDRIRGHFFAKPMHKKIDILIVTKVEYAEFETEADMFLYEIYYINKFKPPFNIDDKARDNLTVSLPDIEFNEFDCRLMDKWRNEILKANEAEELKQKASQEKFDKFIEMRNKWHNGEITEDFNIFL